MSATEPELPRGIALAWGVATSPQRGPKREMSVERIVDAAVEIADADGLGAVSMAAVAAKLGYTPMSLYRYVSAKDDLILLMQEAATGLPSDGGDDLDWRGRLESLYAQQVHLYLAHPWVLDIRITGSPATPNSAAWLDAGLHAMRSTPLTAQESLAVVLLVTGLSRWAAQVMVGYSRAQVGGVSDAEMAAREDALYRALITAEAFPALKAAIDEGVFLDESDPFAFGLVRVLDGVEAYVAARAAGTPVESSAWQSGVDDRAVADHKLYRGALKRVREAEKALRDARAELRDAAREIRESRR